MERRQIGVVKDLFRYPVKSLLGERLVVAEQGDHCGYRLSVVARACLTEGDAIAGCELSRQLASGDRGKVPT